MAGFQVPVGIAKTQALSLWACPRTSSASFHKKGFSLGHSASDKWSHGLGGGEVGKSPWSQVWEQSGSGVAPERLRRGPDPPK